MDKFEYSLLCAIEFFFGYSCAIAAKEDVSFIKGFILSIWLFVSVYVISLIVDKIYKSSENN
jgi:hypothetical protein